MKQNRLIFLIPLFLGILILAVSIAMISRRDTNIHTNASSPSGLETEADTESSVAEENTTSSDTTAEESPEPSGEDATEESTEESPEESTEKSTEESTEESAEENPTLDSTDVSSESSTEESYENTEEEPTEESTEAPTQKPTEAPTQKPTEAPTQKPTEAPTQKPTEAPGYTDNVEIESSGIKDEAGSLEEILKPSPIILIRPVASGTKVVTKTTTKNGIQVTGTIDYSNTQDGYVMVKCTDSSSVRWKARVTGPSGTTYTYNIDKDNWTTLPLSDGNGSYTVKLYRHIEGNSYAVIATLKDCSVKMNDEFAPFIRPNQYVNYENAAFTMETASNVLAGKKNLLEKVAAIYNYVVRTLSYDYDKAATVQSGYLPNLDSVLKAKKGICFDYAALMTGMLRSQGIPCKLVIGYAGTVYHAWISVWSADTGWIDSAIYFNGTTWQRMDPTFASTGGGVFDPNSITYTTKYIY